MHITKLTYDRIRSEYLKLKGSDFDRWYISLNSYEKNIILLFILNNKYYAVWFE